MGEGKSTEKYEDDKEEKIPISLNVVKEARAERKEHFSKNRKETKLIFFRET